MAHSRDTVRGTGIGVLALVACLVLAVPAVAAKKKGGKKRGGGTVDITRVVNAPIPDRPPGINPVITPLSSTIEVPKQGQAKKIRDVNVTVQTLGTGGNSPSDNLEAILIAPNGANTVLFTDLEGFSGSPGVSVGPLTLDDEAFLGLGGGAQDNSFQLFNPWNGTAAPLGMGLWVMDDGPVRGTWTLNIFDGFTTGETSNLVSWRLNVTPGRPFRTK